MIISKSIVQGRIGIRGENVMGYESPRISLEFSEYHKLKIQ